MRTPGEGGFRRRIAFWIVAAVTLVVAHDLVYAVQLGPGRGLADALRSASHGYLPLASTLVAAAGIAACGTWFLRLRRLAARATPQPGLPRGHGSPFRRYLRLFVRLVGVVAVAFLLQENAEHFVSHGHLPGLGALFGPEYPLALPVLVVACLVGALLASLVRERERTLLARIAQVAATGRRPTAVPLRRPQTERIAWASALLARPDLGRAPPAPR
jgi:hypothetical protein